MGIRAARAERLDRFTITGDNGVHATCYEPSPPDVLDDMLLDVPGDLSDRVFVDVGSGKGRVLCLASAYPFRRVLGVEFAVELHRAAEANLERFRAPWRRAREIRSICADAADFEWPLDPLVVFLFNPFRPPVLARVHDRLCASHGLSPRPIHVLYHVPEHEEVLARSAVFALVRRSKNGCVYAAG
jgi:SAM-dependent methyltransferase